MSSNQREACIINLGEYQEKKIFQRAKEHLMVWETEVNSARSMMNRLGVCTFYIDNVVFLRPKSEVEKREGDSQSYLLGSYSFFLSNYSYTGLSIKIQSAQLDKGLNPEITIEKAIPSKEIERLSHNVARAMLLEKSGIKLEEKAPHGIPDDLWKHHIIGKDAFLITSSGFLHIVRSVAERNNFRILEALIFSPSSEKLIEDMSRK